MVGQVDCLSGQLGHLLGHVLVALAQVVVQLLLLQHPLDILGHLLWQQFLQIRQLGHLLPAK